MLAELLLDAISLRSNPFSQTKIIFKAFLGAHVDSLLSFIQTKHACDLM